MWYRFLILGNALQYAHYENYLFLVISNNSKLIMKWKN